MAEETSKTETTTQQQTTGDPWFKGADAETIGYLQNRGLDKKTPSEAALDISKMHREAEKLIGAPANELIRVPKDQKDEAGWKTVWTRLGAPADPKEYDFSAIKDAAGNPIAAPLADVLRASFGKYHVPKETATALAADIQKQRDNVIAAETTELQAKLETDKAALKKSWGANTEANLFIARNAAKALGVSEEAVAALEKTLGYSAVMEMFRVVGTKIVEAKFVTHQNRPGGGVMTREEAVARKAELMADDAWTKRYMAGGAVENRELQAVIAIITAE